MELQTKVKTPKYEGLFSHKHSIVSLGSCFADTVAERLGNDMFKVCANPFGVLFNPESIAQALERIAEGKMFEDKDFKCSNGRYISFSLHSSFADEDLRLAMDRANEKVMEANKALGKSNVVIITFGTAYVYRLNETGKVVANCHREPQSSFTREALSVSGIVERYKLLLNKLWKNYDFKVLFTVSPIRHLRDGIHENQISKSILHLAVEELTNWNKEKCLYYPSYEIMMDELRDYRFYAEDMTHPSDVAVDYIYERLTEDTMSEETKKFLPEIRSYRKLCKHIVKNETKRDEYEKRLKEMKGKVENWINSGV